MSKPWIIATSVLCIALMIQFSAPGSIPPGVLWPTAILIGALSIAASRKPGGSSFRGEFLCDSCKFNDARYCSRPERPNATRCPDYKGS